MHMNFIVFDLLWPAEYTEEISRHIDLVDVVAASKKQFKTVPDLQVLPW